MDEKEPARSAQLIEKKPGLWLHFTSAWLGCACRHKALCWATAAAATLLLGFFTIQQQLSATTVLVPLLAGIILGTLLSAGQFPALINRALSLMDAGGSLPKRIKSTDKGTGFAPLDKLVNMHAVRLADLYKTVEKMEDDLDTLVERYRILTENLAAAVVIRDRSDKIAYCSPYTEVLTGYPISEIYKTEGDFFFNIVHEEDQEKYSRALKVIAVGEPFQFRYRFYHKTGIEMWGETRTVPVLDEDDEVMFSLSITLDVTGTIRYQNQVEEQNRDLEDFAYMISHDLKAPIYTIKGMASVIEEDFSDNMQPELAEPVEHICQAANRLELLVSSVIEYSKVSNQQSSNGPLQLNEVLKDITNDYSQQFREFEAKLSISPELPEILGDRLRVYQIFSNLVGNALKYRSPERALEVEIKEDVAHSPRNVAIVVKDNGLGIPADKLHMIFRPFQRAHAKDIPGSGIGLACVKKQLEKISGDIEVKSQEGVGSTFTVSFRKVMKD